VVNNFSQGYKRRKKRIGTGVLLLKPGPAIRRHTGREVGNLHDHLNFNEGRLIRDKLIHFLAVIIFSRKSPEIKSAAFNISKYRANMIRSLVTGIP
jgi:hypothetical protein